MSWYCSYSLPLPRRSNGRHRPVRYAKTLMPFCPSAPLRGHGHDSPWSPCSVDLAIGRLYYLLRRTRCMSRLCSERHRCCPVSMLIKICYVHTLKILQRYNHIGNATPAKSYPLKLRRDSICCWVARGDCGWNCNWLRQTKKSLSDPRDLYVGVCWHIIWICSLPAFCHFISYFDGPRAPVCYEWTCRSSLNGHHCSLNSARWEEKHATLILNRNIGTLKCRHSVSKVHCRGIYIYRYVLSIMRMNWVISWLQRPRHIKLRRFIAGKWGMPVSWCTLALIASTPPLTRHAISAVTGAHHRRKPEQSQK